TVSRQDAEILTWFFSEGLCEFERSIHGSVMSRVTNGGHVECPTCRGRGFVRVRVDACPKCMDGLMYPPAANAPRGDAEVGAPFQTIPETPYTSTECLGARVVVLPPTSPKK